MRRDPAPSVKFTYDDFVKFPDDGNRHEIIDGEHYVTPSPNTKHQTVSFNLTGLLSLYLRERPIGRAFYAPFDVVLSKFDVVEPDLLYISKQRLDVLTEEHVFGAPDLVVEILSPGTKKVDERIKRALYERAGVSEYWMVDPISDSIMVLRRRGAALEPTEELTLVRQDVLTTPLLPGWSARLVDIFSSPI